jgi:tRNA-specific 2-thiouridylase
MILSDPTLDAWVPRGEKDIAVMMSGGVDSSVAALLLNEQGWNVVGVTMKIPYAESCDYKRSCCGMEAAYVCRDLGIAHYFIDVCEDFRRLVIDNFRESYLSGCTPSPCVDCNTELKFSRVWDFVSESLGVTHLATGHYSRVLRENDDVYLARAADLTKDQSYFLYGITRDKLRRLHLPLGNMRKSDAREIAAQHRLAVARREESMELCFAGEGDYRKAMGEGVSEPGPIVDTLGNEIGQHEGIHRFTVGQRSGIGIASREALYVTKLDATSNTITVGPRVCLIADFVRANELNVLLPKLLRVGQTFYGKVRSQGDPEPCVISKLADDTISVRFVEAVYAPAPGQRLVLYDELGRIAAGGVILVKDESNLYG